MKTEHSVKRFCKHWRKALVAVLLATGLLSGINFWMIRSTRSLICNDPAALPANQVCLVLGTRPVMASGRANLHFTSRMEAAALLYNAGKVRHFLLSGDNSRSTYDEPTAMKNALIAKGVPEAAITLDYAGFRTLDSMARARKVFGQEKLTIVTEEFHASRAAFLARHYGIEPLVFPAKNPSWKWTLRVGMRECAARIKAALDVFVLHRGPKFLGDPVVIR